jgi:Ca2+/Na+ antiporter
MLMLAEMSSRAGGTALLIGGAAALYVASRAAGSVLVRGRKEAPGRAAVALWLPIAGLALVATVLEEPMIAMGVILSTSVAALSLAMGVTISAGEPVPIAARLRRAWPFVLPASLLALLAGMSGRVTGLDAIVMLIEGGVLLFVWMGREEPPAARGADEDSSSSTPLLDPTPTLTLPLSTARGNETSEAWDWEWVQLALAAGLVLSGAWAATTGTVRFAAAEVADIRQLVIVMVLSPLLVAPMVLWGSTMGGSKRGPAAMSSLVGVVLLNLCLLLPLTALLWYPVSAGMLRPVTLASHLLPEPPHAPVTDLPTWDPDQENSTTRSSVAPTTATTVTTAPAATEPSDAGAASVPPPGGAKAIGYPMSSWRIDTVLLVVLGVMLMPWGLGRWTPGWLEGGALMLIYLGYIVAQLFAAR